MAIPELISLNSGWLKMIVTPIIIVAFGGGVGYFIWWKFMKPHRKNWNAVVYICGESTLNVSDKSDTKLTTLEPYVLDKLVYDDMKGFWLVGLGNSVSGINKDNINDWRKFHHKYGKFVEVLYKENSCTLLKSGYDLSLGMRIYKPMPYDRGNSLLADYHVKSKRYEEREGLLKQILSYIIIGILCFAIVGMGVMYGNTIVKISDNQVIIEEMQIARYGVITKGLPIPPTNKELSASETG